MTRIAAVAILAAILAVVVRLPVCAESLWVDELHSAWAIWGDWQEIPERAALGNQTRWYFYALWIWRQLAGDSEIALRLPSVLATALAAAVLVAAVARHGGGLVGGAIAGLLLAIDINAIFFGTETRPYAGVMLAVACAAWAGMELRRGAGGRGRWVARLGLLAACFAGFLWHATAALPLAVLATILFIWPPSWIGPRHRRNPQPSSPAPGFTAGDYAAVVVVMGLALWINADGIFRVWSDRSQWNAFGRPRSFGELWTMWPWIWYVGLPVSCWAAVRMLTWRRATAVRTAGGSASAAAGSASAEGVSASFRVKEGVQAGEASTERGRASFVLGSFAGAGAAAPLLVAALLTTAVAWAVSVWGIAPIWHRRFLVGALPLLCLAAGGFWGASVEVCLASLPSRRGPLRGSGQGGIADALPRWGVRALVLLVAVGGLMRSQGTVGQIFAGNLVLVRRGEDWRGAVAYLERRRGPSEPVFVAAELLESVALDTPPGEYRGSAAARETVQREPGAEMLQYLRYPVAGPYAVPDAVPLGRQAEPLRWRIVEALQMLANGPPRDPDPSRQLDPVGPLGPAGELGQAPVSVWVLLRTGPSESLARIGAREAGIGRARAPGTGASETAVGASAMISQWAEAITVRSFGGVTLVQIVVDRERQ